MVDGIDEYHGREFDWAIETVLYNAREMGLFEGSPDPKSLVDDVWDFILEVFDEEGIRPPDRNKLIDSVRTQIPEEQERRKRPSSAGALSPDQIKLVRWMAERQAQIRETYRKKKP